MQNYKKLSIFIVAIALTPMVCSSGTNSIGKQKETSNQKPVAEDINYQKEEKIMKKSISPTAIKSFLKMIDGFQNEYNLSSDQVLFLIKNVYFGKRLKKGSAAPIFKNDNLEIICVFKKKNDRNVLQIKHSNGEIHEWMGDKGKEQELVFVTRDGGIIENVKNMPIVTKDQKDSDYPKLLLILYSADRIDFFNWYDFKGGYYNR